MDIQSLCQDLLVAAAEEYSPTAREGGVVSFDKLRLFVTVRAGQAMEMGEKALFIGGVGASPQAGEEGIVITIVGMGTDMKSAVGDALAHWFLGTLPVLARWRGQHSCLTGEDSSLETKGGRFTVLRGPLIGRGGVEGEPQAGAQGPTYWDLLASLLEKCNLKQRVHWLELFANKGADGLIEATCRWNNRDWVDGQHVLKNVAEGWPPTDAPLRSLRQFVMLLPAEGDTERLVPPTFWERMRSRA
jgi:hypothetical protein